MFWGAQAAWTHPGFVLTGAEQSICLGLAQALHTGCSADAGRGLAAHTDWWLLPNQRRAHTCLYVPVTLAEPAHTCL